MDKDYTGNTNNLYSNNKNDLNIDSDEFEINEKLIEKLVKYFSVLIKKKFKRLIESENIERYIDMKVTTVNKTNSGTENNPVYHYYYDVSDSDTQTSYESLEYKGSETLSVGDFVRVYVSNIVYIGFKI